MRRSASSRARDSGFRGTHAGKPVDRGRLPSACKMMPLFAHAGRTRSMLSRAATFIEFIGGIMTIARRNLSTRLARQHARIPLAFVVAALAAVGLASADAVGQGKDDLWEVTSKMEMPGMPMAMPAQTHHVCIAKDGKDDAYIPKRDGCTVQDSKRVGNKVTYKMTCTGKDPMTVAGETTFGANSYDGRMAMSGKMDGQQMEMSQTYSGKRVGDCTAAK